MAKIAWCSQCDCFTLKITNKTRENGKMTKWRECTNPDCGWHTGQPRGEAWHKIARRLREEVPADKNFVGRVK